MLVILGNTVASATTVDTTVDGDDGECVDDCSIREAVATAGAGEVVVIPAGTYLVSLGAISIDRDLTIVGEGARHTVILGNSRPRRVFVVEAGVSVQISALSVSIAPGAGGGGGIRNDGDLRLTDCWLRDALNPLDVGGGALRNTVSGTATIERCTLSDNSTELGGAVFNEGVLTIESTTISGNSNGFIAGGIFNSGGDVLLSGSTVMGNVAQLGGAGNLGNGSGTFVVRNSVIGDAMGGPDCEGLVDATGGHNLDGDGTCIASGGVGNLTAAADLGPLADNGGPLPTHAPDPNSPVIDAGSPEVPGSGGDACSASDARGVARPEGAGCDIGAFELATGQDCAGGAADDADGDGLCREDDNCPGGFNPEQGTVIFPHTVVAMAADRFAWPDPADFSFVRGDLDQVVVLGTNDGGEFAGADSLVDGDVPMIGFGFYYLVRLGGECTVASWQTRPGGQAGRDQALP